MQNGLLPNFENMVENEYIPKNVNDKTERIDSWNTLYEIVNEEFEEVK